jgi:hypothetical protein
MTKTYTTQSLIATYRAAKTWEPDAPFVRTSWHEVLTAQEWLAWFRGCLNAKINRGMYIPDDEYMHDLEHDRRVVEAFYHQGVRHRGCRGLLRTRLMQHRYPHVNNQAQED